jgi:HK97 family phage prohead protease
MAYAQTKAKKPYGDVTYADPGYQKDGTKRYPLDSEAHCRAAWSYISMPKNAAKYSPAQVAQIKAKIRAAGKKYGIEFADSRSEEEVGEYRRNLPGMQTRAFDFEAAAGDGRTLEGYAAVFGTSARISDTRGDFDETIEPGAFTRSLSNRKPVMQWEHGKDPRVGLVPIAAIDDIAEDSKGLHVRARLFDNPVVEPIRQAIEGGAVKGMSFRFQVPDGGDTWEQTRSRVDKRRVTAADVYEVGPVVWPAYDSATLSVRSLIASFDAEERRALIRELADELRIATDLTGQPGARSAGGGDPDSDPEAALEGLPEFMIARHRALQMTGVIP